MRIVFVLLDSLNRNAMAPYGSEVVHTPNFTRFQERAITFDNHYVGSLPCMPARRASTLAAVIFCIAVGVLWNHLMIHSQNY